ncbi:hypothetical protein Q1695_005811 [Nippostrongylus brasiliensis]|nr:hypothetical protein Q1695_005811 [Nippostrongylus brasiliensis]
MIEHYKLQGVQHFYIYVKNIDDYSKQILDSYVRSGEAEAVFLRKEKDRPGGHYQLVGIQEKDDTKRQHWHYTIHDTIYSSYNSFATPIPGTIHPLAFNFTLILVRFSQTENIQGDETLQAHLPTLVFHNTSAVLPLGYSPKCLVDPKKVLTLGVHHVRVFFSNYTYSDIDTSEAIIRHYRMTDRSWLGPNVERIIVYGNFTLTYYPKHLLEPLYNNVKKRLDFVYLGNATANETISLLGAEL